MTKKIEGGTGPGVVLRRREESSTHQLADLGDRLATAEIEGNFMQTVSMQDDQTGMASFWLRTFQAEVIELDAKPELLQSRLGESGTSPFLSVRGKEPDSKNQGANLPE